MNNKKLLRILDMVIFAITICFVCSYITGWHRYIMAGLIVVACTAAYTRGAYGR
jgi:hypothetical protein